MHQLKKEELTSLSIPFDNYNNKRIKLRLSISGQKELIFLQVKNILLIDLVIRYYPKLAAIMIEVKSF